LFAATMALHRKKINQIRELRDEWIREVTDVAMTEIHWKRRTLGNAEHKRQIDAINKEYSENLEILVGFKIVPSMLRIAFNESLKGSRSPSPSRRRSRSRSRLVEDQDPEVA
jgi:hypothetical protein